MALAAPRPSAPSRGSVVALGSIIGVAFMGSVIVTPLYALYEREFGFSPITLTLVYATYVVGNVVALLFFGRLSDQVGRKRVVLPAFGLAVAAGAVFLFAQSTAWLFAGRLLTGLSAGILSGCGTAWLAERFGPGRRNDATVAATTANLVGIAIGPLISGPLAQYAPHPLRLSLVVYLVIVVAAAVAVARQPDEAAPQPPFRIRMQPRIGVPRDVLGAFAAPGITGFVIFSVGGLYFALIPTIVLRDLDIANVAVGGLIVCEFGLVGAVATRLARRMPPPRAMVGGLLCIVPAVVLIVLAQAAASLPLLLIATVLGGLALAMGYRGSLEVVNRIAPDDRRGEVVSSYFLCCFVGNAVPVIGIGVLTTLASPMTASVVFAAVIVVLSAAALVSGRDGGRRHER